MSFLPALAAAGPMLLPLAGSALSIYGQKEANKSNAQQAQLNRDFQATQSANAYQTARKDMEAAGINPILAHSQGGAQAMSGSTATMQNPMADIGQIVQSGVGSALAADVQYKKLDQEIKMGDEAINTQQTQQRSNLASAYQAEMLASKADQERLNAINEDARRTGKFDMEKLTNELTRKNLEQDLRNKRAQEAMSRAQYHGVEADSKWKKAEADYKTENANWIVPLNTATDATGRVLDGIGSALNIFEKFTPRHKSTTERIDPRTGEIIHTTKSSRRGR